MWADGRLLIDGKLQDPASIELRDFAKFYATMASRVTWAIRNVIGRHYIEGGGVEDIAQRTWEAILRNWERVGRLAAPEKYTYTVAINNARKALAARNAEPVPDEIYTRDTRHHPHDPGPEAHLELRWLWDAYKKSLAPRQAQVLALALDGYGDKDIAEALNITPEAVRSHRRHARNHLVHRLNPAAEQG